MEQPQTPRPPAAVVPGWSYPCAVTQSSSVEHQRRDGFRRWFLQREESAPAGLENPDLIL